MIRLLLALLLATPAAAETIGEDAALCRAGRGPAIQVDVQGLKDRQGEIWLELYPGTEADFLRDDTDLVREGKAFRRTRARVPASGDVSICVRVPRAGRYALLLRHNRTGKDKFSFWSDGVGFPANRPLGRSKPPFAQAIVDAGAGITVVPIRMQYLRGLGGFAPR
ncbi:DUF2141 domain-containing protein [Sphingomonas sp. RP10(2022)]|uniref:DUF2141 domain-containing protein n=1 Tax=Sphingomonas liriopis TaxID=2949094 RepID=A0A9X2HU70_9SPHN|nr:DUF2141 domain-containing protein [Sphingomonas liriopis]MCP3733563.1 DUF2141 domain-containing protein [Sphingomonas liriopis]